MPEDYSKFLIKDYKYWLVNVHENQCYLGRCIIWCKRENALDLANATKEEQEELFIILKALQNSATACFKPDWFNYVFAGNGTRHLHGQFIPRYAKPKEFMGITFEDKFYGHSYKTDHNFIIPETLLAEVKRLLQKNSTQ